MTQHDKRVALTRGAQVVKALVPLSMMFGYVTDLRTITSRLSLELDWYQKTTKDLLMEQNIPGYIGATNNPISNLGEIRNRGIEAGIVARLRN